MIDGPKTEDEIVKEIERLCNEVIYLATHEPSREEVSKYREQTVKDIEENIFRHSIFKTK